MWGYLQTVRQFNLATRRYLIATALLGFAVDGGVYAVILNLYLLRLGFGPEIIGKINFAGLFTFAMCSLPAGALGARFGYRKLMIAGIVTMACGSWLLPLVEIMMVTTLQTGLTTAYALTFLGLALFFANAAPYVMEITTPAQRNHAFSIQTALLALAGFAGSMVGGFMPRLYAYVAGIPQDTPAPYRFPLFVAALLLLPALWAIVASPRMQSDAEDMDGDVEPRAVGRRWITVSLPVVMLIAMISLIRFLQVAGIGTAATFFNVYMDSALGESTVKVGILSAVGRLIAVPAALVTPYVVSRWGAPRVVVLASTATALFLLPLAYVPLWQAAGIGVVGIIASSSMRYPAYLAYCLELVPRRWRGMLSGAGEMAGGLSFAMMALIGGYMISQRGFPFLFLVSAVLTLLGTAMFWAYFRPAPTPNVPVSDVHATP